MRSAPWLPGVIVYGVLAAGQLGRRDLINDEVYSVVATRRLGETLVETHGTMALYYVLLRPWAQISRSVVWLHLPSVAAMGVSVGFLAVLVARWVGPRAGRWAGIYGASSAAIVRYGVEARSYALWTMVVAIAWYCLDRSVDGAGRRARWAFASCVLALPLLHGLSGIVLLGFLGAIAWARPPRAVAVRLAVPVALAIAVIGLLWVLGADEIGTRPPNDRDSVRRFVRGLVFPGVRPALVLLAIAAAGAWLLVRRDDGTAAGRLRQVGLAIWGPGAALGLVALSLVRPTLASRYALPSTLGLAGLIAVAVTHPVRPPWARLVAPVLALGLLAGQTELRLPNHQWRATTRYIEQRSGPGDRIAFVPAQTRLAFEVSLADRPRTRVPALAGTGAALGTFDRFGSYDDPRAVVSASRDAPRLWVVSIRASTPPNRGLVEDLLERSALQDRFRVGSRREFGEVTIWRLDRVRREGG